MEQKATAVDKQKFYDWITDALYPHKVMTAYEVSEVLAAKKYIPLATKFDEHTKKWVTAYTLA